MKNLLCIIFVIGHASFISNNIILDQNSTQTIFNSADDIFTYTNYFSNLSSNSSIYFSFETTAYEITNSNFSIYAPILIRFYLLYDFFWNLKKNSAQKNEENEEKLSLFLNFSKFVISSENSHLVLRNFNIKIKGLDNYVFYLQNDGTLTFLVKK